MLSYRTMQPQHPLWWPQAIAHLSAADPVMATLIKTYPQSRLTGRGQAMESLMRAIVGQQISVAAAASVWNRFLAATGNRLTPASVLVLSEQQLRSCGLSGQKVKYIQGIASGFADGTVHPGLWHEMPDTAIMDELVKLPGIGRWTAEMFLIFHLLRPDVLPLGDLGLLKGYARAYGELPTTTTHGSTMYGRPWPRLTAAEAKPANQPPATWRPLAHDLLVRSHLWAPYRTAATWYLWRSLDPVEVNY